MHWTQVSFFPLTLDFSCQDGAGVGEGKPGADFLTQCRQGLSCQGLRLVACNDDHDDHIHHQMIMMSTSIIIIIIIIMLIIMTMMAMTMKSAGKASSVTGPGWS